MTEKRTFVEDAAYALTVSCSECGRTAHLPCVAANGKDREYPHLARLKLSDAYRELRAQQTRK